MDNKNIIKAIPYVVLFISIGFTLYSTIILQDAENKCNLHLKSEYEELMTEVERFCPIIRQSGLKVNPFNASNFPKYNLSLE